MMTENRANEKTIRSEVAEELDYVAGFLEARIEDLWSESAVSEVRAILSSWVRDLRTGAKQQRAIVDKLRSPNPPTSPPTTPSEPRRA